MISNPQRIISRMVDQLSSVAGVCAIALVGSRGSEDPSKIDQYSDIDFLICCRDDTRKQLLTGNWIPLVEKPVLVFPQVMEDEIRILFDGLLTCELHILTLEQVERLSGPCRFGSYMASGFKILYDPDELLSKLAARVSPEPPEVRDAQATSTVFWYNVAFCANMVLRGDLFRASHMANRYLQLFLLELLRDIEGPDATKYVARKIRPDQYAALAASFSPLTREGMISGLKQCMKCYWQFQAEVAPNIDPALVSAYRSIEREIMERLSRLDLQES